MSSLETAGVKGLNGCRPELTFRRKTRLPELQLEPLGRLHKECLPARPPPCSRCGRTGHSLPAVPLLDEESLPLQCDLFRLANFSTVLVGTERFKDAVQVTVQSPGRERFRSEGHPFYYLVSWIVRKGVCYVGSRMTPTQMRKLDGELREYFESMVEGMGLSARRALRPTVHSGAVRRGGPRRILRTQAQLALQLRDAAQRLGQQRLNLRDARVLGGQLGFQFGDSGVPSRAGSPPG
jgi:hypothetical protein